MQKATFVIVAAVLAAIGGAAISSPAMAKTTRDKSLQHHGHYAGSYNYHRGGFWPGDVAAGVVGGAIGTAGALATAPFRAFDNGYAYDGSYGYGRWGRGYGHRGYGHHGWHHGYGYGYGYGHGFSAEDAWAAAADSEFPYKKSIDPVFQVLYGAVDPLACDHGEWVPGVCGR